MSGIKTLAERLELLEGRLQIIEGNMAWLASSVIEAAKPTKKEEEEEETPRWII